MNRYCAITVIALSVAFCFFLGGFAQQPGLIVGSRGSGFVVSSDGYILTNWHVVQDAAEIIVQVKEQTYQATIVGMSEANDLALLKIPASGLTAVRLGNSLFVEVLEPVVAMGYPKVGYGKDLTSSTGEITAIRTNAPGRQGKDTLQHNAVITHGSSGGPLFNTRGEVIGINYAGDPPLNWAIPINEAIPLLRSVPGFDVRAMGTATATLSPSQIVARYQDAVVFIDCTTEVAWEELLPDPQTIPWFEYEMKREEEPSGPFPICPKPGCILDTVSWLRGQGFSLIGWAGLEAEGDGWTARVRLFAFSSSDHARRAAAKLLGHPPAAGGDTQWAVTLGDGVFAAEQFRAQYWLSAYQAYSDFLDGTILSVAGRAVFTAGSLVYEVYCERSVVLWPSLENKYEYRDGHIVELKCDTKFVGNVLHQVNCIVTRNLISGEEVARRLQDITDYVATYVANLVSQ